MFQFSGFPPFHYGFMKRYLWSSQVGFPIQKSPDQRIFAPPRSFSQLITSFIGSQCQGIHPAPFSAWPVLPPSRFHFGEASVHSVAPVWLLLFLLFHCGFHRSSRMSWCLLALYHKILIFVFCMWFSRYITTDVYQSLANSIISDIKFTNHW